MWPFAAVLVIYALKTLIFLRISRLRRVRGNKVGGSDGNEPSVTIVLPMYNEEKVIVKTIGNLLGVAYENYSIFVVDDGSTDDSCLLVDTHFSTNPRVRLLRQPNAGKSAALNKALKESDSEIIVTIDADTWVRPDAIRNIVAYFDKEKVAAVAGHIKVGNRVNLLTEMQYYEYVAIWDNDRALSDAINGILIVPGALSAYRRTAVEAVGSFKTEVIAEDTELTLRLLNNNYILRNAADAVAYTEAPGNLKMFFRQRIRWTTGLSQGLLKHSKRLFSHPNRYLRNLVLPMTWLFRVILPFLLPLVDYYFIYSFFFLRHFEALGWWLSILLVEAATNLTILKKYKETVGVGRLIVIQRLYRHLLFCNYWFIFFNWLNGTLFRWRKITRRGDIRIEEEAPVISVSAKNK